MVGSPVRQGLHSLQLDDTGSGSVSSRGTFAQITQGEVGVWVRRTSSGTGGTDLYVYGNGPTDGLAAVVGLGGTSRQFHYWDRSGFHDVVTAPVTQWTVDTWYYVSTVFNTGTNTYNFVVYDTNLAEVVRVDGISMWRDGTPGTYVNSAMLYTDGSTYIGRAYWDDFRLRKNPSPALTVQVGVVDPIVNLSINKTANAGTIYMGDRLTYTISILNTSLYAARAVDRDRLAARTGQPGVCGSKPGHLYPGQPADLRVRFGGRRRQRQH